MVCDIWYSLSKSSSAHATFEGSLFKKSYRDKHTMHEKVGGVTDNALMMTVNSSHGWMSDSRTPVLCLQGKNLATVLALVHEVSCGTPA